MAGQHPADVIASAADAFADHRIVGESRNLGQYRTEVDCACGAKLWWGEHEGDPTFHNVWHGHVAVAVLDTIGASWEYGTAIRAAGDLWNHAPHASLTEGLTTVEEVEKLIDQDDEKRPIVIVRRLKRSDWQELAPSGGA
ncbi:hypothetical protein ACFVAJ_17565 [Agromyces sp. NPDC057679]|uniref:hypothetical protein n=1 Tax=Agromyces sp. NPDC057679 TaxID=3346207 RepID=UPI00366B6BAF